MSRSTKNALTRSVRDYSDDSVSCSSQSATVTSVFLVFFNIETGKTIWVGFCSVRVFAIFTFGFGSVLGKIWVGSVRSCWVLVISRSLF